MEASGKEPTEQRDEISAIAFIARALEDEQVLADRDQALADADRRESESDQTAAGRDQAAADSDQTASDHDLAHGGDPDVHNASRQIRSRSAQQRQYSAYRRSETAEARDQVAHARDVAAMARDQAAALRDREPSPPDGVMGKGAGVATSGAEGRGTASERTSAAEDRARSAADRDQAAHDRAQAVHDRAQGQADRDTLREQLAAAQSDGLTGTRSRATGLEDLAREIDRAHRTMAPLVVAYVDVVGLKAVNDTHGHGAGDELLRRAVDAIRSHLRSYDLIVRIGGDEFLAVMSGATIDEARQRFVDIQATLAADPDECAIKIGFATLEAEDSSTELIQRADAQLPASRRA